jgi:hypothetical protein
VSEVLVKTARFHLRRLTTDDVTERYVSWLHDDVASRYIEAARNQNDAASLKAYVAEQRNREDVLFLGIFEPASGSHIGNIKFQSIDPTTGFAEVGILIGEKSWWGKGVAVEVMDACAGWLQLHRSVHWIRLGVLSSHEAAIRAYRKAGFTVTDKGDSDASGVSVLTMVRDQRRISRLALGTAQFGQIYGIANRNGMMPIEEAATTVACAREAGFDTLDTAIAYGESERRLGEIGVGDWRVVSKLPPLPKEYGDVDAWVRTSVMGSLARLGLHQLWGILLHHPSDLLGPQGVDIYDALTSLKKEGLVKAIGVSIYGPDELEPLCSAFPLDLVQAPYNVVDQRIVTSGWLARLGDAGVSVHARSAFLQGLLLMPRDQRPNWASRWDSLWNCWHNWLDEQGISALEACLGFTLANRQFERVIVGVDSLPQLEEILAATGRATAIPPETLATEDLDLINPSRWSRN